jgi:hypothetical protein
MFKQRLGREIAKFGRPPSFSEIAAFFSDKVFQVPEYQRYYSWEMPQWEDFWNDIKDGFETNTPHYWGTITLEVTGEERYYEQKFRRFKVYRVVDGQQRITTLYLFMLALYRVGNLPSIKEDYILTGNVYRLELSGPNGQALKCLVDGRDQDVDTSLKTNRLLKGALQYFEGQIRTFGRVNELVDYVLNDTYVLEFVIQDPTLAIKTFEVLNDRGKPLSLLDKTKSYLMFMCYRYVENDEERRRLFSLVNEAFGKVFANFDTIKENGEREGIEYINRWLTEDELLRLFYHYFANYAVERYQIPYLYNYEESAERVFDGFLKISCMSLKDRKEKDAIKAFIEAFLVSFEKFASAFARVTSKVNSNIKLKKLLSFLGLNVHLYPLLISLEAEGMLTDEMLDAIECLDVRVYGVKGREPRAQLYSDVTSRIRLEKDPKIILEKIRDFIKKSMRDPMFQHLDELHIRDRVIKYILWEYEKYLNPSFDDSDLNLYKKATVEHIFPLQYTFSFPAYGFKDVLEYYSEVGKIGNLTLLEGPLNSRAGNKPPQEKANIYIESKFEQTRKLGFHISNYQIDKDFIEKREEEIVKFCLNRWKI